MSLKKLTKTNALTLILMGVTAVTIAVTGIVYHQTFFRILPLFVSIVIAFLQSRVSRLAPLLGGINSILYAAVYFHYALYASAAYAFLVSFPLQIITFLNWSKNPYGVSVRFRVMSTKGRILSAVSFAVAWGLMYIGMSFTDSAYMLFDNTATLFGIFITVLTMLAYIEYTWLMIPNCLISVGMYIAMLAASPEQITYLVFSVYSLICNTLAFVEARRLFAEQNASPRVNENTTPKGACHD